MSATAPAGSLFIELAMNMARLDQDTAHMQRTIGGGMSAVDTHFTKSRQVAEQFAQTIDRAGSGMRSFAQLAESSAAQAERSFASSFAQISKMADHAMKASPLPGGGLDLGVNNARDDAASAMARAEALGRIEEAARRAAAGTGVMTEETRLYLQAANAARIEAEAVAASLDREAQAIARVQMELTGVLPPTREQIRLEQEAAEARERSRLSSERYAESLEREARAIGMTSAAVRSMEIDGNANAAAAQGFDDLAQRIRNAGQAMDQARMAAAAQAAETDRLAREAREAAAAQERYAQALKALRADVDPLAAAQGRLNDQLDLAVRAFQRGDMNAEEYERTLDTLGSRMQMLGNDRLPAMGASGKLAGHHMTNLAFQFQDLGIQMAGAAASGDHFVKLALMALLQQGSQISGIMMQAGVGVKGLTAEVGGMIGRFASAHPYLVGFAAAAAIAAGAAKLFAMQLSGDRKAELDAYTHSLGLSEAQLRKLGPLTIEIGDVFTGLGKTMSDELGIKMPNILDGLKKTFMGTIGAMLTYSRVATSAIYAGFVGTFNGVRETWGMLPSALGDVAYSAANVVIDGLNWLIKKGTEYSNKFIGLINSVMASIPGYGGKPIEPFKGFEIANIGNPYAGQGKKAAGVFLDEYTKAFNAAEAKQKAIGTALSNNIVQAAKDRYRKEAEDKGFLDPKGDSAKKSGKKTGYQFGEGLIAQISAANYAMEEEFAKTAGAALKAANEADFGKFIERINAPLQEAQEKLRNFYDILGEIKGRIQDIDFSSAFGEGGGAIMQMASALQGLREEQSRYNIALQNATNQKEIDLASANHKKVETEQTFLLIGASKKLFNEKSAGYKVLETAEKVMAALQMANTIRAMVMDATHTTSSVANSTARATADQAAGASKIFSQLGWWAFPVVAAMIAVLSGLGVGGGGGGAAGYKPPSADDLQESVGTGTVYGDRNAQSDSIARSLEILAANSNEDLEFSNSSVGYLRSISEGINKLTGQVGQQLGLAGGMFDTSSFRLGETGSKGILGLFGGGSTTRSLYDQGIQVFSQSVDEILSQGFEAQVYNVIEQVKKSNGFLGIGGSTKTTYETITGKVNDDIAAQMALIVGNVSQSVLALTGQLGIDVSRAVREVELPQISLSFKDMSGDEIESALQAYFSSVADRIARVAMMFDSAGNATFDIADFQRAGEGLYETLARVTRSMLTVSTSLNSIGMAGLNGNLNANATASTALVAQFGDLDAFQSAVSKFGDTFLTEAERMAPIVAAVRGEMARLGQAGVTTNDQFKSLVLGLDLNTTAGQEMFGALMTVAPAFAKVTEHLGTLDGVLSSTGKSAQELATIQQRMDQRNLQILELEGRTDEAKALRRKAEIDAADELERAQIILLHQRQDEADVAKQRADLEKQIAQLTGESVDAKEDERAAILSGNEALYDRLQLLKAEAAAAELTAQKQKLVLSSGAMSGGGGGSIASGGYGSSARNWAEVEAGFAAGGTTLIGGLIQDILTRDNNLAFNTKYQADRTAFMAGFDPALRDQAGIDFDMQRKLSVYNEAAGAAFGAGGYVPGERTLSGDELSAFISELAAFRLAESQVTTDRNAKAQERAQALREAASSRELEILDLMGKSADAAAKRLQAEKDAADKALWPIIDAMNELSKLKERETELTNQVTEARNTLTQSYEREKSAITSLIDRVTKAGTALRDTATRIFTEQFGAANNFRTAQVDFMTTAALAAARDVDAMERLPELSQNFLTLTKENSSTREAFERQAAYIASSLNEAGLAADGMVDERQATLEALNKLVEGRIDTAEKLVDVKDAIQALDERQASLAEVQKDISIKGTAALERLAKTITDADGGGALLIRNENGDPLTMRIVEGRLETTG